MFTFSSYKPDTGALYHKMDTLILSPHHSLLNKALHEEFHVLLPICFVVFYFQLKIVQYSTDFGLRNAEAFNLNTEVSLCK